MLTSPTGHGWKKSLPKKSLTIEKTATFLLTALLLISFFVLFSPQVTATATAITSISPEKGHVGTEVQVNGTIQTANGTYQILFDGEEVKNGTIVGNNVSDTFIVPHRPAGDYKVTLKDLNATSESDILFTVKTAYYVQAVKPAPPNQLQEGNSTQIWVNVTGGKENTAYSANITVANPNNTIHWDIVSFNTTNRGYGKKSITYPDQFLRAHTNFTGVYKIAFNKTLASDALTIGLTNATEYYRYQVIDVQAAGYAPKEPVNVTITSAEGIVFYSENITAPPSGIVTANWTIPANAVYGNYTVEVSNSTTSGTVKPVLDVQNFAIAEKLVDFVIITVNLDSEPVEDVKLECYDGYNATKQIGSRQTDEEGSANFMLEVGYYNFTAFWKGLRVNQTCFDVVKAMNRTVVCPLANIKVEVREELTGERLPFIDVNLTYNYTKNNSTLTETNSFETNSTGRVIFRNLFTPHVTKVNYTIEARRYGNLFYTGVTTNLTATCWVNVTCPTYTLTVEVFDSKQLAFRNATLAVYEWSSGLASGNRSYPFCIWMSTNISGSATVKCPFGRYKVKVYVGEVVVNWTSVDLINETQKLRVYCNIFNLTVPVKVVDYFGQAIPNVKVEVKREDTEPLEFTTAADGTATLHIKIGGDCQILLYLSDSSDPCETRTIYLDWTKNGEEIEFKLSRYVIIGRYLIETSELTTIIILVVIVVFFVAALAYRKLSRRKMLEKVETEKDL